MVNLMAKRKILLLVEGAKRDVALMRLLFQIYTEIDAKYEIVSYNTNIYTLYRELFEGENAGDFDLLQVLKSREPNAEAKKLFDERYTDILLIFDLDPHDPLFTADRIRKMQAYFSESSDMGKLYINYPMVEAFYHMRQIPAEDYNTTVVTREELVGGMYKARVGNESRGRDFRKFITGREDCTLVIQQNLNKAFSLLGEAEYTGGWHEVDMLALLNKQLSFWAQDYIHVLATCCLYIYDYDYKLLG